MVRGKRCAGSDSRAEFGKWCGGRAKLFSTAFNGFLLYGTGTGNDHFIPAADGIWQCDSCLYRSKNSADGVGIPNDRAFPVSGSVADFDGAFNIDICLYAKQAAENPVSDSVSRFCGGALERFFLGIFRLRGFL